MMTKPRQPRRRSSDLKLLKTSPQERRSPGSRTPQYLFDCWDRVSRRVRLARQIVIFLDFDGTLVRLRHTPGEVFLGEPARRVLRKLVGRENVTLCFISGRQLDDLRLRARVEGAIYFGLHGWERSNGQPPDLPGTRQLRKQMQWVQQQVRELSGVRVEDKGICFGVHYRAARRPEVEKACAIVKEVLARLGPGFGLLAGKKIWEIYPKDMGNKGKAAQDLLQKIPGRKLVIYAGDDTTDETAFELLRSSVTIRVGKFRETKANFCVKSPSEVLLALKRFDGALP
ncbi:MAG TPA: trehalose-phosphatase [Terriglobia bacterium]|nr:trehalose-phosphatase [Terriglobia bacterium]